MPPRLAVAAVLLFWLAANGWLFYREIWPYWRPGDPPPYTIDLTQELGSASVNWKVFQKGQDIGDALSQVERQPDRTYKLRTKYVFKQFRLIVLDIRRLAGVYHVTEEGELLGLSTQIVMQQSIRKLGVLDHELEMNGKVVDGKLVPEFFYNKEPIAFGKIEVPIANQGGVLNPMHLLNRLPGLSVGRRWRIALFDPLKAVSKSLAPEFQELFAAVEGMTIPELQAEVVADTLEWDDDEVACFKIEYRKPGEHELVAATWVRGRDGLVLQQFCRHELMEMTLKRVPVR
jgi:hypothetical protein